MAEGLLGSRSDRPLRLVDPCVGPGTFPLALAATDRLFESDRLVCIDVDPEMTAQARRAQSGIGARIEYLATDYLKWQADQAFDGAILNPPYIRQEWITDKAELRQSLSAGDVERHSRDREPLRLFPRESPFRPATRRPARGGGLRRVAAGTLRPVVV